MKPNFTIFISITLAIIFAVLAASNGRGALDVSAQQAPPNLPLGNDFTYQGRLSDGGLPAEGVYDFEFSLFDLPEGGALLGVFPAQDIVVSKGNFTVTLDFGPGMFNSQKRWLQIGVRPGNDQGVYTPLNPRQEITQAPLASYAVTSEWNGLLNMPAGFADGVDDNTLYSAGFGLNLVDSQFSVNSNAVQARVVSTCTPGSSIRTVNADGSVTCEADDNTTYSAGFGLGLSGTQFNVDTGMVQARVGSNCSVGSAIRAINADGTVECEPTGGSSPLFSRTPLDVGGQVTHPSVAIGPDGLPIIVYTKVSENLLHLAHCDNPNCTTATISSLGSGAYPTIMIGSDDLPLVVYPGTYGLTAAHCSDAACTSVTYSDLWISGSIPQLTLGTDGLGVFSAVTIPGNDILVGHCNDAICSSATATTIDTSTTATYASITIGPDGFPLVAYDDQVGNNLKVAHCSNASCTSATLTTLDTTIYSTMYLAITTSSDGHGLIIYQNMTTTATQLKVAYCLDVSCTSFEYNLIDYNAQGWTSATVAPDTLAVFAYFTPNGLKVVHCKNPSCSLFSNFTMDNANANYGSEVDLKYGADGFPVVVYDSWAYDLLAVHCDDPYCVP